jgi:hypothetical protein
VEGDELLGGLIGVGKGDSVAGRGLDGFEQEAIGIDVFKDRPADGVNGVGGRAGEKGAAFGLGVGETGIGEADDVAEAKAIGRGGGRFGQEAAGEVTVDGVDHFEGEVPGAGEGGGAREGGGEQEGEDHRLLMIAVPGK